MVPSSIATDHHSKALFYYNVQTAESSKAKTFIRIRYQHELYDCNLRGEYHAHILNEKSIIIL